MYVDSSVFILEVSKFLSHFVNKGGGGGGVATQKNRRLQQISNFKFGTGFFFRFFHFGRCLTGLTGSGLVVLIDLKSFYKTLAGLHRH